MSLARGRVEQLDVEIAAPNRVFSQTGTDNGGGQSMRHRRFEHAVSGAKPPASQKARRTIRDRDFRKIGQSQAQTASIDLNVIADIQPKKGLFVEIDQDMIYPAMLARHDAARAARRPAGDTGSISNASAGQQRKIGAVSTAEISRPLLCKATPGST